MHLNPPQWWRRPQNKSETGKLRPRRTWGWKTTDSFIPSWENIHYQISFNGSRFGVGEDALLQDQTDGNRYTYSISTREFPLRVQQLHPPSPSQQTSWGPWGSGEDESLPLHAQGLAVASFSWQSEAREDELAAAEQTKLGRMLNLDLLEALNKQRQCQYCK